MKYPCTKTPSRLKFCDLARKTFFRKFSAKQTSTYRYDQIFDRGIITSLVKSGIRTYSITALPTTGLLTYLATHADHLRKLRIATLPVCLYQIVLN